jgi:hypothetical protein
MKSTIALFAVYLFYLIYYYYTRDNFLDKFIETTIVFGVVAVGAFIYDRFFKRDNATS